MHVTLALVGSFLIGQGLPPDSLPSVTEPKPARTAPPGALPEMAADALVLPPGSDVTGQPLALLAALAATPERLQQLEITRSYWRLVEAVAVYRSCLDYESQLRPVQARAEEEAPLRTARASSLALVREAEVSVVAAQHDLAALLRLASDAPLPLPADAPHVGPYRTDFAQLFSNRAAPVQARMLDRTLPIRLRAIEQRALAVKAAEEATTATREAHRLGRAGLHDLLACLRDGLQQRQALMASICRYNWDIADYALAVVPSGASPQALVARLIKSPHDAVSPSEANAASGVRPAALHEPVPTPARRPGINEPTPAVRPGTREPTPAPPRELLPIEP